MEEKKPCLISVWPYANLLCKLAVKSIPETGLKREFLHECAGSAVGWRKNPPGIVLSLPGSHSAALSTCLPACLSSSGGLRLNPSQPRTWQTSLLLTSPGETSLNQRGVRAAARARKSRLLNQDEAWRSAICSDDEVLKFQVKSVWISSKYRKHRENLYCRLSGKKCLKIGL